MGDLIEASDRFKFSETGLEMAKNTTFDEWVAMGDTLKRMDRAAQWWIGDWLNSGEKHYGEMYAQAVTDATGRDEQTLMDYKWVATAIAPSLRKENVSYGVHKEISSLPEADRAEYLDQAEKERWSVREARKHVRALKALANKTDPPPLPEGKYSVILADPPWRYEHMISESREIENHYPTMDLDEICELPVAGLAADEAMLFLWTTAPHLQQALHVVQEWGFEYRTGIVWVKPSIGPGYYVRTQHEHLLIARRGEPGVPDPANKPASVIEAPRGKHSEKPPGVYELIENAYPHATCLELFARNERPGWASWGNETS